MESEVDVLIFDGVGDVHAVGGVGVHDGLGYDLFLEVVFLDADVLAIDCYEMDSI